jgi:hypothetical protein
MKFTMRSMWKTDMSGHDIPFADMVYVMWKSRSIWPFYYYCMNFS